MTTTDTPTDLPDHNALPWRKTTGAPDPNAPQDTAPPIPPPPTYAPTVGLNTTWWTQTPAGTTPAPAELEPTQPYPVEPTELAAPQQVTPAGKPRRVERITGALTGGPTQIGKDVQTWRTQQTKRANSGARAATVRRWCALTFVSASTGYALHLPQLLDGAPIGVGVLALLGGAVASLYVRGGGKVRVVDVRGFIPVAVLIVVRIPVASALIAVLHLTPLITLISHHR